MSLAHDLNGSRRTKGNNAPLRSIYTTPTRSLNRILLDSERRAVNLTSASPNACIDGADVSAESVYRHGAVKGWRNRRARAVLRSEQSRSPEPAVLPHNDLTRSLHSHSAQFYTRRELLDGPRRQKRTPWETKKRKLLETEGTLVSLDHVDADTPILESRALLQTPSSTSSHIHVREQEVSLESSKPAPRSAYKRRDMYRALDASAIIALGVLTEEYIQEELRRAGYVKRQGNRHRT